MNVLRLVCTHRGSGQESMLGQLSPAYLWPVDGPIRYRAVNLTAVDTMTPNMKRAVASARLNRRGTAGHIIEALVGDVYAYKVDCPRCSSKRVLWAPDVAQALASAADDVTVDIGASL